MPTRELLFLAEPRSGEEYRAFQESMAGKAYQALQAIAADSEQPAPPG